MKQETPKYGIIETVDLYHFIESVKHSFSCIGAEALYNYLNELAAEIEQNIELDPVDLRCEYTEYKNALEACEDIGLFAKTENEAMQKLENETMVIQFNGGIIVEIF